MRRQTRANEPRWQRTLRSADTIADDLGLIGASVGPRTGPNRRTNGEKEDYILRRLLAEWKSRGRLQFPVDIRAERDGPGEPDFLLCLRDGKSLGIEITEAGEQEHQRWLTRAEPAMRAGNVVHVPFEADTQRTADEIIRAISRKVGKYAAGSYGRVPCHLVVYDTAAGGGFLDKRELIDAAVARHELFGGFAKVHLISGLRVWLDISGSVEVVDVSDSYEIDVPRWASVQAEQLRRGSLNSLDREHIAGELEDLGKSERRALASHVRNLLLHFLKYEFQPKRRSASWRLSIEDARADVEEILSESPSLRADLGPAIEKQYRHARSQAATQTRLALGSFPEECPYSSEQLLDAEYLPSKGK